MSSKDKNSWIKFKSDGKVDFRSLKYNLNDLFHETPNFDVPPLNFELFDTRQQIIRYNTTSHDKMKIMKNYDPRNGWSVISQMILHQRGYKLGKDIQINSSFINPFYIE